MDDDVVAGHTKAGSSDAGANACGDGPADSPSSANTEGARERRDRVPILIGIGAVATLAVAATIGVIVSDDSPPPRANKETAISLCKESISGQLKDPESARFGDVTSGSERRDGGTRVWDVAGTVNAKNSFGGYVGTKPFTCTATLDEASGTMSATGALLE
ncbi:hypothetical protein [Tsukamurella pulmonis]|uniref:hypothetical protein n=1 Tax=Tsukamurella pulmonis TaxID=47312 RepID=UPI000A93AE0F|nr:hypothetical protein [Tsukamurella pulmonis]